MSRIVGPETIAEAAACLRAGGVVAFPTETVYGLGADALNVEAVRRVFAIKGRPADHPLIVHLASAESIADWAVRVPDAAWELSRAFWPGPLTLVLPRRPHVPDAVTGGQESVALRVPAHPLARELITAAGALVAPSANRFGRVSPTTAAHVAEELGEAVDLILDGGPCAVGVESTIVSLLSDTPVLLRPGRITPEQLEGVLHCPVARRGAGVRAPGLLPAHYAPSTPIELVESIQLDARAASLAAAGLRVAVLERGGAAALPPGGERVAMPPAPGEYARALYATLRTCDRQGFDRLLVELPPVTSDWLAVHDRLTRAARAFGALHGGPSDFRAMADRGPRA